MLSPVNLNIDGAMNIPCMNTIQVLIFQRRVEVFQQLQGHNKFKDLALDGEKQVDLTTYITNIALLRLLAPGHGFNSLVQRVYLPALGRAGEDAGLRGDKAGGRE